jgi:hypothetical protein
MSKMKAPKEAFEIGSIEKYLGYPEEAAVPFDPTYEHSPLYGKVDRRGNASYLVSDDGSLNNFEDSSTLFAVNFVVRAFEDFKASYRDALIAGATPVSGWQRLRATSAWVDFEDMYASSLEGIRAALMMHHLKDYSHEIRDFKSFMKVCFRFINEHGRSFPLTRSSNLLSAKVPRSVSGLVVSLKEVGEESRDAVRSTMVAESNFVSYTHKAAAYGFWVNRDSPWELVANLASPVMQEYAVRSGVRWSPGSASDFFERYHMSAHLNDLDDIRAFFMGVYREYLSSFPHITTTKYCNGKTHAIAISRKPLDEGAYDVKFWIDVLIRVKLAETRLDTFVDQHAMSKVSRRAMLAYDLYGLEKALNSVNTTIKKMNSALSLQDANIPLDKPPKKSVYYT